MRADSMTPSGHHASGSPLVIASCLLRWRLLLFIFLRRRHRQHRPLNSLLIGGGGGIKNMEYGIWAFHSEQSGVKLESRSFPLTAIGNLANRFQSIPIRSSIQSRSGFKSSDPIDLQPPAQPIRSSSDPGGERRRELRNSIKSNLIQSNYWIMQIQFAHLTGNHLASPPPPLSPPSWSQTPPKMKKKYPWIGNAARLQSELNPIPGINAGIKWNDSMKAAQIRESAP